MWWLVTTIIGLWILFVGVFPDANANANANVFSVNNNSTLVSCPNSGSDWEQRYQIAKLSRSLRDKEVETSEWCHLLSLSYEEVVNEFMQDQGFADSLFRFHSSLLHSEFELIRIEGNINPIATRARFPIRATHSILQNSSELGLLDSEVPFYWIPRTYCNDLSPFDETCDETSEREAVAVWTSQARERTIQMREGLATNQPRDQYCNLFFKDDFADPEAAAFWLVYNLGPENSLDLFATNFYGHFSHCITQLDHLLGVTPDRLREEIAYLEQLFQWFSVNQEQFLNSNPQPRSFSELNSIDTRPFGIQSNIIRSIASRIQNSSTNLNRKRGALALETFFCDNLTPLPIPPASAESQSDNGSESLLKRKIDPHAGLISLSSSVPSFSDESNRLGLFDRHATDPKCMACHYKLDPMAGFFRKYGADGLDFSTKQNILFSDQALAVFSDYQENWYKEISGNRVLDVGFIRSATDSSSNEYGSSDEDLLQIIRRAPEFNSCYVRKMVDHYIGDNQAMDGFFMRVLSADFAQKQSSQGIGVAVKDTLKTLMSTNVYKRRNPNPNECYDFVSGMEPGPNSPPCRVNYIVQRNCVSCHGGSSPRGGLSLDVWEQQSNSEYGFRKRINSEPKVIFQSMIDRIIYANPWEDPMPPRGMNPRDREQLFFWLTERVQELSP